ncbi:MAG: hypothetical protein Q9M91_07900 [Candidatus Dojkabacteria bacterium]|nr:hypothetical protein [Candidatus Dojkabacteria bacterium]
MVSEKNDVNYELSLKDAIPYLISLAFIVGIFIGVITVGLISKMGKDKESETVYVDSGPRYLIDTSSVDEGDLYYSNDYLNSVIAILEEKYITDLPNSDSVNYELVKGYINALDDKYTNFLDPEESQIYMENRSADFEGVGIALEYDGTYTYVETVLKGFPAESAGMIAMIILLK